MLRFCWAVHGFCQGATPCSNSRMISSVTFCRKSRLGQALTETPFRFLFLEPGTFEWLTADYRKLGSGLCLVLYGDLCGPGAVDFRVLAISTFWIMHNRISPLVMCLLMKRKRS